MALGLAWLPSSRPTMLINNCYVLSMLQDAIVCWDVVSLIGVEAVDALMAGLRIVTTGWGGCYGSLFTLKNTSYTLVKLTFHFCAGTALYV